MYNKIFHMDVLEYLPLLVKNKVRLVLMDLPYGTTMNSWDKVIPMDKLWPLLNDMVMEDGVIALFAQSPFDKALAMSNIKNYRYEWIWHKTKSTGFLNAGHSPLNAHENILIFYKKKPSVYNPQKTTGHKPVNTYTKHKSDGSNYGKTKTKISGGGSTERYPTDVLLFSHDTQTSKLCPTQKPVALCEYLIKTYTNIGDIVLDGCCGSGSVPLAARNLNRIFIACEKDESTYLKAYNRLHGQ